MAEGKRKAVALGRGHRRHHRHQRLNGGVPTGFMTVACQPAPTAGKGPSDRRVVSIVVHPTCMATAPDAVGFRQVHSRRRWLRKVLSSPARSVPTNLVELCFNCLASDHVKVACRFLACCLNCKREGHCARDYVIVGFLSTGKMGHSPSPPVVPFGVLRDTVRHHTVRPLQGH